MGFVMQLIVLRSLFGAKEVKTTPVTAEHVFLLEKNNNKQRRTTKKNMMNVAELKV